MEKDTTGSKTPESTMENKDRNDPYEQGLHLREKDVNKDYGRRYPGKFAPMLPDWLAYLYTPVLPLLRGIHIRRSKEFHPNPRDIFVPQGYTVEVVASGFNAPDHCTFDDQGNCYLVESGHKIEQPPRILKVDVRTGDYSQFYQFPPSRWHLTGAVTGAC